MNKLAETLNASMAEMVALVKAAGPAAPPIDSPAALQQALIGALEQGLSYEQFRAQLLASLKGDPCTG